MKKQSDNDNLNEGSNEHLTQLLSRNTRSIHEVGFCNTFVGSLIDWYNPSSEVIFPIVSPLKLVLSLLYQFSHLKFSSGSYEKTTFALEFLSQGFKIILRLTWGFIKGCKITNFIANLQFNAQAFMWITSIYDSKR